MKRRKFLQQTSLVSVGLMCTKILQAVKKKNPVIIIVSGWQDVNIGDIAHTPGLIGLLKKRMPGAKLILWKKSESEMVDTMLLKYFPGLQIIHGKVTGSIPQTQEVKDAFVEADYFIHGSGPSVVAADYAEAWSKQTGKPFGIFGVTIQEISPSLKILLDKASFIFTRETASVQKLKTAGVSGPIIAFAPDATFALSIHDDIKGKEFLTGNKLEPRKFICVVPRLRMTPYYKIRANSGWSEEKIQEVDTINEQFAETDHAKMRVAMITWVRKTGNKVLICPEMTYEVDVMDKLLIDPLPADVKPFVIKRGYWLPDEAASVYREASVVLSFECHSPIIAAANGTPCFYLRQPTDTIKGQMYYDLGFNDWIFEIDDTTGEQVSSKLMDVFNNYEEARKNVTMSLQQVGKRYDDVFKIIEEKVV